MREDLVRLPSNQRTNPEVRVEMMDSEVDILSCEISCSEKIQNLEVKDVEPLKSADEGGLGPVTPVPDRRIGEPVSGSDTPLTWVSSPPKAVTTDFEGAESLEFDSSVRTPNGCVFDPFAPGPDVLMFAPRKKTLEELRARPMRRLDFDSYDVSIENVGENDVEVVHDESFLESVYESILDVIISKQAEGILAEDPSLNLGFCDGFKTPSSSPLLNGISESCPGAPVKPAARESRKYDFSIYRKLEF